MVNTFSGKLLNVSLFQGFSRLDFLDIVEHTPLDFHTFKPRAVMIERGTEVEHLCLVLNGEVEAETESPDHTYLYRERLHAPFVVEMENLFGLHNRYTHSLRALTTVQMVTIDKQSVRVLLQRYPTFQINFYNQLSTRVQNSRKWLWVKQPSDLQARFRLFLQQRSVRLIGEKFLRIKMTDLAEELGTTRLRVSQMLGQLSEKGALRFSRGNIFIHRLENI